MSTQPATIHDLLVHADFLRRVVRDLVADDATREDLTQEVWLQAMRSPPRESHGLRGWIATTARNLSANRRRSGARRAAREEFASPREPSPDVAEILERESVRESVLRAVLELDEPFRGAVLLRYYEGLAPRDIAARLGVPDATVRTRLARGLERLRKRLDGEHGERGAWVSAVLPLARPDVVSDSVSASMGLGPIAAGLALVVGGLAAWYLSSADDATTETPAAVEMVAVAGAPRVDSADVLVTQAPSEAERSAVPATERPDAGPAVGRRAYAAERGRGAIHGVVLDDYDAPLPGVRVSARPSPGGLPPGFVVDEDRTPVADVTSDAAGRFRFEGVEEGPVRVAAVFADGRRLERGIVLAAREDVGPVQLSHSGARPQRGDRFHVLVVDARGEPVANAAIEAWAWSREERDPARNDRCATESADTGRTGADGRATLRADIDDGIVLAVSADGRAGWKGFRNPNDAQRPLRIVVEPTGSISGTILGVEGGELRGARLSLHALSALDPYFTVGGRRIDVDLSGPTFEVTGLAAGTYALSLQGPSGVALVHPRLGSSGHEIENSVAHVTAEVRTGTTARIELAAQRGAIVRGRVVAQGRPVAGARVRAVKPPRTSNFPSGFVLQGVHVWRFDGGLDQAPFAPVSHVVTRTDADGRYQLESLVPGNWRIEVAMDGLSLDRREDLDVRAGELLELVHDLVPAGVLQVGLLDATCVGVFAPDAQAPTMLAIVRDGCGTFAGLAPGTWRVASVHTDASVPPRFLGNARVEAGRLTWLDLRDPDGGQRTRLRGSVSLNGSPVAGAEVALSEARALTDASGRFELRLPQSSGKPNGSALPILVRLGSAEHAITLASDSDPTAAPVDIELTGRTLTIQALDGRGDPARARVEAMWMPITQPTVGRLGAQLSAGSTNGRFEFAAIDAGTLQGSLEFEDGWIASIECPVPTDDLLRVRRPASGTLTVRVIAGGRPVEGRNVHLANTSGASGSPRWNLTRPTDARGLLEVDAPSGVLEAWISAGFSGDSRRGSTRLAIDGAAEIVLEVPE